MGASVTRATRRRSIADLISVDLIVIGILLLLEAKPAVQRAVSSGLLKG
jgi:hypothetical protein